METFALPLSEIRDRFTTSEIFMIGWRSQEQHYNLKKKMKNVGTGAHDDRRYGASDMVPEGLPSHFYNDDGEVDLSRVKGVEAKQYMKHLGIPFPEFGQISRL